MPKRLLFAVTSHGWGHLTRTLAIADALVSLDSEIEIVFATTHDEARIALDFSAPFRRERLEYEPGTLQRSCFEMDLEGTARAYESFVAGRTQRIAAEQEFLRTARIDAVVADIPALVVRAAGELGIPAFGVGNFTWDWILAPLFAGTSLAAVPRMLREDYGFGRTQLRLPFGPETSPFPESESAPLVSRVARLEPDDVRQKLGLPDDGRPLVVVCPGGWDPEGWSPVHVAGCADWRFVTVGDLPITAEAPLLALPHSIAPGIGFVDLVAAADVILAKPGYGIASECAVHGTPLVAIERPGFPETPVLLEQCRQIGVTPELSLANFFAGSWEPALTEALAVPWQESPRDGAKRVAARLRSLVEGAVGR